MELRAVNPGMHLESIGGFARLRVTIVESPVGTCGIVILHFEKLQKTPDTSQEFMNTMQCSILSGSMSIHTSRVVIHTKNVNPVRSSCGAHQKLPLNNERHVERLCS